MSNGSSAKGNPASKRMSNPKLKAKFARCWENGQRRKKARREAAALAEQRNRELIEAGELTPWQAAKAKAAARRAGEAA